MLIRFDGRIGFTDEDINQMFDFVFFLNIADQLQCFDHIIFAFELFLRKEAVVTTAAVVFFIGFSEIMEQYFTPA